MPALWNFQKADLKPYPYGKKIHHFFFSHTWDTRFTFLPEGCPYMLMYSALHIMQWFSQILDVLTPKIKWKFFDFYILWIKTNVAYTRLEVIAKQQSALQVEFITGVKLICYFVLYHCILHWSYLPNMAVGDLAFYYTLYLWGGPGSRGGALTYESDVRVPPSTSDVGVFRWHIASKKGVFQWQSVQK